MRETDNDAFFWTQTGQRINCKILNKNNKVEVSSLFASVFSASEGKDEGALVGKLAAELSSNIDHEEIICFGAFEEELLIACVFFTRLRFTDPALIYMFAPVAVSTEYQGKGIGQALINDGLRELKRRFVAGVVTYGDPAFYSKVGFQALSENVISAPLTLSMPEGWLGQSLFETPIPTISERPTCVKEFNDPAYW